MRNTPQKPHKPQGPTPTSTPPAARAVIARMPPDMHRRLRMAAAARDMSMAAYVVECVGHALAAGGHK